MKKLNLKEMESTKGGGVLNGLCYTGGTLAYVLGFWTVFTYSETVSGCENADDLI